MKNRLLGIGLPALALICCLVVLSCKMRVQERSATIEFGDEYVVIEPTKISDGDYQKMESILAKYDKSLYRIQRYSKGATIEDKGSMKHRYLGLRTIKRVADGANAAQRDAVALRAGRGRGGTSMLPFHPNGSDDKEAVASLGRGGTSMRDTASAAEAEATPEAGVGPGGTRLRSPTPSPVSPENTRTGGTRLKYDDRALAKELKDLLEKYNR
jgi:hypothetical protein